jgi:thioredoxin
MKFKLYSLLMLFCCFLSCKGQHEQNFTSVSPAEFSQKITNKNKVQIIDVRTPEEFKKEQIAGAINENWNDPNFANNISKYDKSKPIFVYCLSGGRSKKAAEKMANLGFKEIYELQGGIMKWNAEGFSKPSTETSGMSLTQYNELVNSDKKVLISFYADWCAPCKKMAPYILKMQKELANEVKIIRIDADENKTLCKELKVSELPTLLLYEQNAIKWQKSGFVSEEILRKSI